MVPSINSMNSSYVRTFIVDLALYHPGDFRRITLVSPSDIWLLAFQMTPNISCLVLSIPLDSPLPLCTR